MYAENRFESPRRTALSTVSICGHFTSLQPRITSHALTPFSTSLTKTLRVTPFPATLTETHPGWVYSRHSPLVTRHFLLTPLFPLDRSHNAVSSLFPTDTKNIGGGGSPLFRTVPFRYARRAESIHLCSQRLAGTIIYAEFFRYGLARALRQDGRRRTQSLLC
jgi:hypothetical protein